MEGSSGGDTGEKVPSLSSMCLVRGQFCQVEDAEFFYDLLLDFVKGTHEEGCLVDCDGTTRLPVELRKKIMSSRFRLCSHRFYLILILVRTESSWARVMTVGNGEWSLRIAKMLYNPYPD